MLELHQLETAGLNRFIIPCALLVERFQGIEVALDDPEEAPTQYLNRIFARLAGIEPQEAERTLVAALRTLPAYRYRAGAVACVWSPLEEPLRRFQERNPTVNYWRSEDPNPTPSAIDQWLRQWL